MDKKTALLFGSTGLVGNLLLEELIKSEIYTGIKTFVRQPTGISNPKVEEIVMDFSVPEDYAYLIKGDDLYICIGSTIRKAGSVENFEKIDRDLPVKLASIAKNNGINRAAVVSSIGAKSSSGNYYLRIKGEMEQAIIGLGFNQVVIARPSMLLGERDERRPAETIGKIFMKLADPLISGKFRKYKAIHGRDVARAMISAMQKNSAKSVYESDELQLLANKYRE
jgi:uncharacterized protein YbjT (DUF2867 family)